MIIPSSVVINAVSSIQQSIQKGFDMILDTDPADKKKTPMQQLSSLSEKIVVAWVSVSRSSPSKQSIDTVGCLNMQNSHDLKQVF